MRQLLMFTPVNLTVIKDMRIGENAQPGDLAHVDAGKTSLTERLLYNAGVIDQIGSVDQGSTQTDTLALERARGITIKSAVVSSGSGRFSST